ncbi:MAG TPA: response regulator, partial [Lysobacter sp.]
RALVIDDNQDSADTLAMMLELLGHETRRLYDPRAAVETVAAFAPDVVFLDIGMPGLSGYDVARMLRASPQGSQPVLVAVTGWGQPDDRRRTFDAGFDHHLVKPPEMAAICQICDELPLPPRSTA